MSEFSGQDEPSQELAQSTLHTFTEIEHDLARINIGDTVTELNTLTQVDALVSSLAQARLAMYRDDRYGAFNRVRYAQLANTNGKLIPTGWHARARLPSGELTPKKVNGAAFHGRIVEASVTLLGEDVTPLSPNRSGYEILDKDVNQQVFMMIKAGLHSTGRGVIGHTAKLITVTRLANKSYLTPKYADLSGANIDTAFELLLADSEATAHVVTVNGLRRAYAAGLPSLGRRSR